MLQIRLDFDTFTITGPSTSTASVTRYYDSDKQLLNKIIIFRTLWPFYRRRTKAGEVIYEVSMHR